MRCRVRTYVFAVSIAPALCLYILLQDSAMCEADDASKVKELLRQAAVKGAAIEEKYAGVIGDGVYDVLETEWLLSDRGFKKSDERLKDARSNIHKYKHDLLAFTKQLISRVEKLKLTPEFKKPFRDSYEESLKEKNQVINTLLSNQLNKLSKLEQIISIYKKQSTLEVEDGEIVFEDDKDVDEYNTLLDEIEKLEEANEQLLTPLEEKKQKALDAINE